MTIFMAALTRVAAIVVLCGATLPMLSAAPASAVAVNVDGIDYDLSSIITSPVSQPAVFGLPPLGQMPWWGHEALASEFASKAFAQLGSGSDPDYGPVFAHALDASQNQVLGLTQSLADINDQIDVTLAFDTGFSYAVASPAALAPVPAPLPLFGAGAAFGFSRRVRAKLRNR